MNALNVLTFKSGILDSNDLYLGENAVKDAQKKFREEAQKIASEPITDEDMQIHLDNGSYDNLNGGEVIITWPVINEEKE